MPVVSPKMPVYSALPFRNGTVSPPGNYVGPIEGNKLNWMNVLEAMGGIAGVLVLGLMVLKYIDRKKNAARAAPDAPALPDREHELAIRNVHDEPSGTEARIVAIELQAEDLDLHEPNFEAQVLAMLAEIRIGEATVVVESQHLGVDAVEPSLSAAHRAV